MDEGKVELIGNFIAPNTSIRKEERSQINDFTKLQQQEQMKPKVNISK